MCSVNWDCKKEKQNTQKTQQSNLRMSQESLTAGGSISPRTQVKKAFLPWHDLPSRKANCRSYTDHCLF